ncbi:hypothetical protein EDD11_001887 [Mortierella claussenii]|nr:hypothetical protein EDD11_001887 [Mortierella claussenii]
MPRQDISSAHMEEEVPRGQSPTMSMSNTVSTTTSTYDMRPSDYASMKQYQAHVWRRNLLEESIMHSLRLGYSERQQRSSLRYHQGRPSKKDTPRARRAREQAILAAATGKENSPFAPSASEIDKASQENIIDRSLKIISSNDRTLSLPRPSHELPSQQQFRYEKNSPYQLDYNASMTNIRHSFASFTLEVDDHHATHIMASSAVPELFRVKGASIKSIPFPRPQSRRNSRSSLASIAPSPRVLTGKKPALPSLHTVLPDMQDEDEEDAESPLTPTSAVWAESVFASLDVVAGKTSAGVSESEPKALGV